MGMMIMDAIWETIAIQVISVQPVVKEMKCIAQENGTMRITNKNLLTLASQTLREIVQTFVQNIVQRMQCFATMVQQTTDVPLKIFVIMDQTFVLSPVSLTRHGVLAFMITVWENIPQQNLASLKNQVIAKTIVQNNVKRVKFYVLVAFLSMMDVLMKISATLENFVQ